MPICFDTVNAKICQDPTEYDQISTLSNGLRVATEALPGPFSGVGVYVDAGSRYENEELSGVSHIVDRLAFKSTSSRSSDEILEIMESLGGNIQCASSRESMMYQSATFNKSVPTMVDLLAETIRKPNISQEEVSEQLETAEYEIKEIWSKPELILPEMVNVAAYRGNTLGNPLLCPQERIPYINKSVVEKFRDAFYQPHRIVLAFAGVAHEEAMKLAERYFGDMPQQVSTPPRIGPDISSNPPAPNRSSMPPSPQSSTMYAMPSSTSPIPPQQASRLSSHLRFLKNLTTSASAPASISPIPPAATGSELPLDTQSQYTGGFLSLPKLPPPTNPALPDLTHVHLGFEALPISSEDINALATLQTLLGGGGSFSDFCLF